MTGMLVGGLQSHTKPTTVQQASCRQVRSPQEPVPAAAAGGAMSSWNLPAETRAPQATL